MSATEYDARCFAECHTSEEIQDEIDRCSKNRNYQWNEVGCAHFDSLRVQTLRAYLIDVT